MYKSYPIQKKTPLFFHPHSERLLSLQQDCEINDEELKSHRKYLDEKCEICIKYK